MNNTFIARGLIVVVVAVLGVGLAFFAPAKRAIRSTADYYELVAPSAGKELPIIWDEYGIWLVEDGVIVRESFLELYKNNPAQYELAKKLLDERIEEPLIMTRENSSVILNLLWAFGLANKNRILTEGPIMSYGGDPSGFASTGGWSLSMGSPMDYYAKHELVLLTSEQQALVEKVSKNIYRPCCDNSTYFPDCNHGMAMLGLLEIAASQGWNEKELYEMALIANSYWFTSSYADVAQYLDKYGQGWENTAPEVIVGREFSSLSGYYAIKDKIGPQQSSDGVSCGV